MKYHQIVNLFLQSALVAFIIPLLFAFKSSFGIEVVFNFLGLFQGVQAFLWPISSILIGLLFLYILFFFTIQFKYITERSSTRKK